MRANSTRNCSRCCNSLPPRPVIEHDVLSLLSPVVGRPRQVVEGQHFQFDPDFDKHDFESRVRRLKTPTSFHIPSSCRQRVCDIMSATLEGIADNEPDCNLLELYCIFKALQAVYLISKK